MSGMRTTGIEEQVTRSAATLLYGHAMAWDVPGHGRPRPTRSRRIAAGRVATVVAGLRLARRRPAVAVDVGPCS